MSTDTPQSRLITYLQATPLDAADVMVERLVVLLAEDPKQIIAAQAYAIMQSDFSLARTLLFIVAENLRQSRQSEFISQDWAVALALLLVKVPRDNSAEINALAILEAVVERSSDIIDPLKSVVAKIWESSCRRLLSKAGKAVIELAAEHVLQRTTFLDKIEHRSALSLWKLARRPIEAIEDIELRAAILADVGEHPPIMDNCDEQRITDKATKARADLLSRATELLVDFRLQAVNSKKSSSLTMIADGLASLVSDLPSLMDLETGIAAHSLTLKTNKQASTKLKMSAIGSVIEQFEGTILEAVKFLFGKFVPEVSLVPIAARPGSYIMDVQLSSKHGAQAALFAILHLFEKQGPLSAEMGEAYGHLINTLAENGTLMDMRPMGVETSEPLTLTLDARLIEERRNSLRRYTEAHLLSSDIPQADDLDRVIKYVQLLVEAGSVEATALEVSGRQVAYYAHAARVLGLIGEHLPLSAGRQLLRIEEEARLRFLAACFEGSKCGLAWLNWANATDLRGLDPSSAEAFLSVATQDLSPATTHRRAQTLISWCTRLQAHHYATSSQTN